MVSKLRIFLTGFGPFGDISENPTSILTKKVKSNPKAFEQIPGFDVKIVKIDTLDVCISAVCDSFFDIIFFCQFWQNSSSFKGWGLFLKSFRNLGKRCFFALPWHSNPVFALWCLQWIIKLLAGKTRFVVVGKIFRSEPKNLIPFFRL